MIDTFISSAINGISILISFFPMADVDIITNIAEFSDQIRDGLAFADAFFPVQMFLWIASTIFIIETGLFTFKTYRWLVSNVSLGFFK